ncbi:MAG TPA: 3-oxoacyl-[acyl-carrier-protein] synthase III C-terminal domain-containing protein [Magnetospirillaceae bacterium]|nr:3-oxoacyl-[acyl-carrier-protein] synthase III C-terminal domain-containing protein [Magnetospirillaceae bacterium]
MALTEAGWDPSSLDVLVGACGVMEQPIPGTAALIHRRLGLGASGIPAFDVNATCLSFLAALQTVLLGFLTGRWRRALIVSADIASAALDFTAPEASAIFGDGAAAIALEADGPHRLAALRFATYSDGADACRLEAGGTRLRPHEDLDGFLARSRFAMDSRTTFKITARYFPPFLSALLAEAGIGEEAISTVVPHQASAPALEHLKRSLSGGHDKTVDIFRTHGNQIATSLPTTLHHARRAGRLTPGSLSLLVGSSAGISLGGAVIQW